MANIKWITIKIPINEGGPLDKRIKDYCKAAGRQGYEEDEASMAALLGIEHHMHDNLAFMERNLRKCVQE